MLHLNEYKERDVNHTLQTICVVFFAALRLDVLLSDDGMVASNNQNLLSDESITTFALDRVNGNFAYFL